MARQDTGDTPSVDIILESLAKRPNVRSTLILSRKDGSIIKMSGLVAETSSEGSGRGRSYSASVDVTPGAPSPDERLSTIEDGDGDDTGSKISPAQVLASNIYAFVSSAATLGQSLNNIEDQGKTAFSGRNEAPTKTERSALTQAEDDVQLLRLRLKKHEIIVFPDPNYISCVVQDLEKVGR